MADGSGEGVAFLDGVHLEAAVDDFGGYPEGYLLGDGVWAAELDAELILAGALQEVFGFVGHGPEQGDDVVGS